jgi:hypothetical protein
MPRRFRPTGRRHAPSIDYPRIETQTEFVMNHGDDARAEELNNLRLALATFVLQLDAFEMRMHEGLPKELTKKLPEELLKELPRGSKSGKPVPPTDQGGGPRKDN